MGLWGPRSLLAHAVCRPQDNLGCCSSSAVHCLSETGSFTAWHSTHRIGRLASAPRNPSVLPPRAGVAGNHHHVLYGFLLTLVLGNHSLSLITCKGNALLSYLPSPSLRLFTRCVKFSLYHERDLRPALLSPTEFNDMFPQIFPNSRTH